MVKYKLILNKILKCYYLYIIAKLNNISKIIYLFKAGIHKYKPSKLSIESESIHI